MERVGIGYCCGIRKIYVLLFVAEKMDINAVVIMLAVDLISGTL